MALSRHRPPRPAPLRGRWWGRAAGAVLVAGMVAAGCAGSPPAVRPPGPTSQPFPVPSPRPSESHSVRCRYAPGDLTEYTPTGYRFLGTAEISNLGNVAIVVRVEATFYQPGADPVRLVRTGPVPFNATTAVALTKPVGHREVALFLTAESRGEPCTVTVRITGTYGAIH